MKKENAKIEALKAELKTLNAKRKALNEKRNDMIHEWTAMEGKYALRCVSDDYAGQGCRGYYYEYADDMEKKELAERDAFRAKMYKETDTTEINKKIYEIKNALCLERYGYGLEEQKKRQQIKTAKANIEALKRELEKAEAYLKELEEG